MSVPVPFFNGLLTPVGAWRRVLWPAVLRTVGDWPGTIAAMVVRSLRSKMCLSPFLQTVLGEALNAKRGLQSVNSQSDISTQSHRISPTCPSSGARGVALAYCPDT